MTTQKAAHRISVAKEMVKVILRRDGERGEGGSSSEPSRVSAGLTRDMRLHVPRPSEHLFETRTCYVSQVNACHLRSTHAASAHGGV